MPTKAKGEKTAAAQLSAIIAKLEAWQARHRQHADAVRAAKSELMAVLRELDALSGGQ